MRVFQSWRGLGFRAEYKFGLITTAGVIVNRDSMGRTGQRMLVITLNPQSM